MAVVQISRIQLRRGRESTTGIPQLAGGEMGWAVDTQRLYIGNGSVAEGAPYVGNTEVLTEHSNLLDVAQQYTYKRLGVDTGSNSLYPIERSLQERLDEHVSVASFGAVGDGIADDTAAIQRALDELFFNGIEVSAEEQRVILEFLPGVYKVTATLNIPPFANIKGAGKDKTIIFKDSGTGPLFKTVGVIEDSSDPEGLRKKYTSTINEVVAETMPRYINIVGVTFENTTNENLGYLLPTRNSLFENVKFVGNWNIGSATTKTGLALTTKGLGNIVSTEDNKFINCEFENFFVCVDGSWDINSNVWKDCIFKNSNKGILTDLPLPLTSGRQFGASYNKFLSNKFIDIYEQAIDIRKGTGNLSSGNSYILVGNAGGNSSTAITSVVHFGEPGNVSTNDYFERSVDLVSDTDLFDTAYIGEFSGSIKADHKFNTSIAVEEKIVAIDNVLFRMAAFNTCSYRIHYLYKSQQVNIARRGVISLFVDKINNKVHLTDEYDFLYATSPSSLSSYAENLIFTASLADSNTTVEVKYTNQTANDTGTIEFWYEVVS
jgi:hypothetical protein